MEVLLEVIFKGGAVLDRPVPDDVAKDLVKAWIHYKKSGGEAPSWVLSECETLSFDFDDVVAMSYSEMMPHPMAKLMQKLQDKLDEGEEWRDN